MTNFSTNQVMQFYALDGEKTISAEVKPCKFDKACKVVFTDSTIADKKERSYASDKIENVMWGKITTAEALKTPLKEAVIKFAGDVKAGENYILRVSYPQVPGLGVEGWTVKTVGYCAKAGDTADNVLKELQADLAEQLDIDGAIVATLGENKITITSSDDIKYKRGVKPFVVADFKVSANGWAEVDKKGLIPVNASSKTVSGDYKIADMEYFAMGERADEYRMMGYPDVVDTDYKVKVGSNYNVLNVHFAYKGANSDSHKSEKDLVIVSSNPGSLETIAKAIEAACGVKFTKVNSVEGVKSEELLTAGA